MHHGVTRSKYRNIWNAVSNILIINEVLKMKLNKQMSGLIMAGVLPCFSTYATPMEATATLNVAASTAITHALQATSNVHEGSLALGTILARGNVVRVGSPMQKVSLAWVRSVNPKPGDAADYAEIHKEGGTPQEFIVAKLMPADAAGTQGLVENGSDKVVYTLSEKSELFQYNVVNADAKNSLVSGSYKMSVQADVVNA
ncbi:hypothetical protein ZP13_24680 [Salmonella enterica subsp. enterica]|nr:hypothetical protein [Salmonella enterica subsp. enterica]ECE0941358.1 hypothetical protein [Salmonella enterica subsp. enterica]ECH9421072.1 hypothetical protein [Salmonella enterica subsp. enterica]ECI2262261.1 hypothetical protein [Salmonella enterica subsp. enterica]